MVGGNLQILLLAKTPRDPSEAIFSKRVTRGVSAGDTESLRPLLALALGMTQQGDVVRLLSSIMRIRNKHMHRIWREYTYHSNKEDSHAMRQLRAAAGGARKEGRCAAGCR